MAKLEGTTKWDDPMFGQSYIRADGRKMHDMYLFEVKKPSESKGPWDYYKLVSTISGEEAFRPMDQGECPLVKKELGVPSWPNAGHHGMPPQRRVACTRPNASSA